MRQRSTTLLLIESSCNVVNMLGHKVVFFLIVLVFNIFTSIYSLDEQGYDENEEELLRQGEEALGQKIMAILDHFKQEDPVGLPGAKIPDPKSIPDMKHSFSVATMQFKNVQIYGLSKFKIKHVMLEASSMVVNGSMKIDTLYCMGNYTMSTWLSRSQGAFIVHLSDISVQGLANLGVERDGKLRAQDINMDITFSKIEMDFKNLGFMGNIFQGILNSVGTFLFDSIKPMILKEAYVTMRTEINKNLEAVSEGVEFPNSISPLDMVIADYRNKVRAMGMDPYKVKDYNTSSGVVQVHLTNTWIMGISSFHRVGNISLSLYNNSVFADFEIGTQRLKGQTQWEIEYLGGLASRAGTASFSVEYISARVVIGQPLDTRKKPEFKDLQLEVGNIQVRCDGAGTLDYAIEASVNILPNLLRYQIIDAIEGPIQEKFQQYLNGLDVELIVKSKIPEIEEMSAKGFKLSSLKEDTPPDDTEDDDFWKFNEIVRPIEQLEE